ncbi:MAG: Gfo/Idh/MocA family oxidoreductase [Pirellulales bacterium]|nr:Gfo/Idh/MocA family oxidoreductase [Pirellulales bacterium]
MSPLDRRDFLHTAVVGAAAAATQARAAAPTNPPSENLHFALVGAGGQGRWDTSWLLKTPGAKLTAICEINPLRAAEAKQMAPDARVYSDWNEMFAQEHDLQAALVALPEHTHAEASIAAMNAGLDVFCEKPMAFSVDEARQMIAARDTRQRILQIGQQRRSNPLYYLAERLVQQEGIIGEVLRVDAFWDRWSDWKFELPELDMDFRKWGFPTLNHLINWRLYRRYGHGLITENGTHQMDAATWLLGGLKAKRVAGMGAIRYHDERETHDICTAEYLFENDTIVRFSQDFHQGFNYGWSYGELLLGSEGSLRVTAEQEIVHYDRDRKATRIPIERLGDCEIAGVASSAADLQAAEADRAGGGLRTYSYGHEMRIFNHCVRTRTQPACTGEIGHNAIAFTVAGADAQYDAVVNTFDERSFLS